MKIRSLLEKFSRNIVFQRTLQTPNGGRRLYVTPEACLRFWLPNSLEIDKRLNEFVRRYFRKGMNAWDLGSNVGIFSYLAASIVSSSGKILTVEADPHIAALLLRTNRSVPFTDARPEVLTVGVSDSVATAVLAVPERSRASNYIIETGGCTQTGGVRATFRIVTVTPDWLLDNTFEPQIVKMDIEGMEFRALNSSPRLLSKVRPVFHLEVWENIASEMTSLLLGHDYYLFDGDNDLALNTKIERATWSTIAVPREKLHLIKPLNNLPL